MKLYLIPLIILMISGCSLSGPIAFKSPPKFEDLGSEKPIPIVAIQPIYPRHALIESIEGYVVLEFNVAADGSPKKISIKDSFPEKIFVKSALRAFKKWRFKPQNLKSRYRFSLEYKTN